MPRNRLCSSAWRLRQLGLPWQRRHRPGWPKTTEMHFSRVWRLEAQAGPGCQPHLFWWGPLPRCRLPTTPVSEVAENEEEKQTPHDSNKGTNPTHKGATAWPPPTLITSQRRQLLIPLHLECTASLSTWKLGGGEERTSGPCHKCPDWLARSPSLPTPF